MNAFATFLGSSALLVYSMGELSKSIQYLAGSQFRTWLNRMTQSRLSALGLGMLLSVLMSSSGAVSVMLVGLATARLLTIEQVFAVTLGAAVGTTLIVHLIALKISEYGLLIVFLGVLISQVSSQERARRFASTVTFLGMLFFSLDLLSQSAVTLKENPLFLESFAYLRDRPVLSLALATVLTAFAHSSAAIIGFVMTLMEAQGGAVQSALPWVLGANLGTTTTAFFASVSSGVLGRQVAVAHFILKFVGILLFMPILPYCAGYLESLGVGLSREIAISHTGFNIVIALIFFPFISYGVRLVQFLVPEKEEDSPFVLQFIEDSSLDSPELALAQAQREILRVSDTVENMLERSIELFRKQDDDELKSIESMDRIVDFLNKGIKRHLTQLSQHQMTEKQMSREFSFILRTNDLEGIGDIVEKNILRLVRKSRAKGYEFSEEGWQELKALHGKVMQVVRLSAAYFNARKKTVKQELKSLSQEVDLMVLDLSQRHLHRLHEGQKVSLDSSQVHLDLMAALQRIASLATNCVKPRS